MFISISFGYKLNKFFTINCLSYPLMDNLIQSTISESLKLLKNKEEEHINRLSEIDKIYNLIINKKEDLEIKIQEKIEKGEIIVKEITNKKPAKNAPVEAKDPLEIELEETKNEIKSMDFEKNELNKKIDLIQTEKTKYNDLVNLKTNNFDLVDNTSTRKYINTKLDQKANEFLTEKKKYYLVLLKEEDEIELLTINGFLIRNIEEDERCKNEIQFELQISKKPNKKK